MRSVRVLPFLLLLAPSVLLAQGGTVACSSSPGQRQHCDADTSAGVALEQSTGTAECVLGKTWGYDDTGIWVSDGCSGNFILGEVGPQPPGAERRPTPQWGAVEPGKGFLLGKTE